MAQLAFYDLEGTSSRGTLILTHNFNKSKFLPLIKRFVESVPPENEL